jgi:hypothetical protein
MTDLSDSQVTILALAMPKIIPLHLYTETQNMSQSSLQVQLTKRLHFFLFFISPARHVVQTLMFFPSKPSVTETKHSNVCIT